MYNHRIRVVDALHNAVSTIAGNGKAESIDGTALSAALHYPMPIGPDPFHTATHTGSGSGKAAAPDLLFASEGLIRRLNRATGQLTTVKLSEPKLDAWHGVATPSGWLLMAITTHALYAVDPRDGQCIRLAGGNGSGFKGSGFADGKALTTAAFADPRGLALGSDSTAVHAFVVRAKRCALRVASPAIAIAVATDMCCACAVACAVV